MFCCHKVILPTWGYFADLAHGAGGDAIQNPLFNSGNARAGDPYRDVNYPRTRGMKTVVDPRRGDIEDDASSTKRRSLLSLVGSLLGEISLPRLAMAWILLVAMTLWHGSDGLGAWAG